MPKTIKKPMSKIKNRHRFNYFYQYKYYIVNILCFIPQNSCFVDIVLTVNTRHLYFMSTKN